MPLENNNDVDMSSNTLYKVLHSRFTADGGSHERLQDNEEKEELLSGPENDFYNPPQNHHARYLIAATIFFATTTFIFGALFVYRLYAGEYSHPYGSFHGGFVTEMSMYIPEDVISGV